MSASPAGYDEPAGEPRILHTICWACWNYVEGCSSMNPMCVTNSAPGSHNNRTTCCFHPSEEANELADAQYRQLKEEREKRTTPREYVTIRIKSTP